MLKLIALAALAVVGMSGEAFAADAVFSTATTKGLNLFSNVKTIVFIMGGFGLVGLAVAAIFGAVKWKWFASLAFGLAIVAAAGAIIDYSAGTTAGDMGDTFG